MLLAMVYRVSWNQWSINTAPLLRFLLAALVLLAVTLAVPLVVAALSPVAVGCCSFVVANAWQLALVPVVFGGMWMVKP